MVPPVPTEAWFESQVLSIATWFTVVGDTVATVVTLATFPIVSVTVSPTT
jgi:hypothetical protein